MKGLLKVLRTIGIVVVAVGATLAGACFYFVTYHSNSGDYLKKDIGRLNIRLSELEKRNAEVADSIKWLEELNDSINNRVSELEKSLGIETPVEKMQENND